MMKSLLGFLFISLLAPAAHAEMKWSGGAGTRYVSRKLDDSLAKLDSQQRDTSVSRNKRYEFRGSLNVSDKGETVDWGIGLRTQPTTSVNSEWLSVSNNSDWTLRLEQAYGRFHTNFWDSEGSVAVGRQKTVILYDNVSQVFLDNDNRWDGFGWQWKKENFGLNVAQYILGATNAGSPGQTSSYTFTDATQNVADTRGHFGVLYSFQPFFAWKVNEEITANFAIGYHSWSGTGGSSTSGFYNNTVHGGQGAGTSTTESATTSVAVDNAMQWQLLTDWSLPYNLRFVGEYIRNKKVFYGTRLTPTSVMADHDAWALSLVWGKPKKAGDFSLAYSYSDKGIASVVSTFTNGDAAADNTSHFFEGKYMVADGLALGAKAQFHREKGMRDGLGVVPTGVDANHNQKMNRYELISSVAF